MDEWKSAYQKSIRRGMPEALQWAFEMAWSGADGCASLWARSFVTAAEDIGPADPFAILHVWSLYCKAKEDNEVIAAMVLYLVHAKKCRITD